MTAQPLSLHILTPHATLFQRDDVTMVIVPGVEGDLGVMAGHLPLLTTLRSGMIQVFKENMLMFFMEANTHHSAAVNIQKKSVTVLLNYFCPLEDYSAYVIEKNYKDDLGMPPAVRIESQTYGDYRIERDALLNMTPAHHTLYQSYAQKNKNPTLALHLIK